MGQKLGQHFLNSRKIAKTIVDSADISPGEKILEIGPGKGFLTEMLLNEGADVLAVEKDPEMVSYLKNKFANEIRTNKLVLIEKDIRDFDISSYVLPASPLPAGEAGAGRQSTFYKLVANIPYYITGELLKSYLSQENQPDVIVFLVQNEVAKRIVARDNKESILSISVKVYGKPTFVKKVSKRYFSPPPKVDSAILKVENISKEVFKEIDEEVFFKILKTGFAQKRKKLVNNLEKIADKKKILEIFAEIGIDSDTRAENVSLEKWSALAKILSAKNLV